MAKRAASQPERKRERQKANNTDKDERGKKKRQTHKKGINKQRVDKEPRAPRRQTDGAQAPCETGSTQRGDRHVSLWKRASKEETEKERWRWGLRGRDIGSMPSPWQHKW